MNYCLFPAFNLMERFEQLQVEISAVQLKTVKPGSGHSGVGYGSGWIEGLANTRLSLEDVWQLPYTNRAIEILHEHLYGWSISQILVNDLAGGGKLRPHRDGHTGVYRFHLPVLSNPHAYWWDEIRDEFVHLREGYWHGPMPHQGVLHSMENESKQHRVHLIVDLKAPE